LIEEHDAAGMNSVVVVLQLAFMERTGRAGRLAEDGAFATLLRELLHAPFEEHLGIELEQLPITLVAHSAGYESALAILEHGGADVRTVILLDALYSGADRFASWLSDDDARTLISLYTGRASTYRESQRLTELTSGRARVERSPHPHGAIPRMQLTELLAATLSSRRGP
jgi:pimeloyl-ACP methyl ester carboxylesterase